MVDGLFLKWKVTDNRMVFMRIKISTFPKKIYRSIDIWIFANAHIVVFYPKAVRVRNLDCKIILYKEQ